MKLIDKDALVAEIEKLIERAKAERVLYPKTILAAKNYLLIEDYKKLLSSIDTLEVKEVDLAKEYDNEFFKDPVFGKLVNRNAGIGIAKHFFELGLKASNQLTWEDIRKIDTLCCKVEMEHIPKEEEYYEEVLKRFKA